jgi:hypothetical protein
MDRQPNPRWMEPFWVRMLLVAAPALWAAFELVYGEPLWAAMFGAAAVWGFFALILRHKPPDA